MYDVIIIGAGASGLLTAALYNGKNIAVLERNNEPAKKIYATGNGHCNFLNRKAEDFDELEKVLSRIGIVAAEEDDGRLYPRSREASFVSESLISAAKKNGAEIICDCHITDIQKLSDHFRIISKDGRKFQCEKMVIATAGKAGIQYGCYGEGYRWAQYMGHSLVKPVPALVPVECIEDISSLHGVRVKGKASLLCNGECIAEDMGEIQFTRDAISGICVMNLSAKVRLADDRQYVLSMDLFPEYSKDELASLFSFQKNSCGSELAGLVPKKLQAYIYNLEKDLLSSCKELSFNLKGTKGWSDAQVTSGGIPMDEIDENSMESTKVPGLFFTGEILDYDGPCGGYNLSHAWRTAIKCAAALSK